MPNATASWQITFGPALKATVTTDLGAATISDITVLNDPGTPIDETDTTLLAHFAASIAMAQSAMAALTGPAPNAKVLITGYRDLNTVAPLPATSASKIDVNVTEFWT